MRRGAKRRGRLKRSVRCEILGSIRNDVERLTRDSCEVGNHQPPTEGSTQRRSFPSLNDSIAHSHSLDSTFSQPLPKFSTDFSIYPSEPFLFATLQISGFPPPPPPPQPPHTFINSTLPSFTEYHPSMSVVYPDFLEPSTTRTLCFDFPPLGT